MAVKSRSGFSDWEQLLLKAGAQDVLKNTRLESSASTLGFWCYQISGLFQDNQVQRERICKLLLGTMEQEGAVRGRSLASTAVAKLMEYKTWQASGPGCCCKYECSGTANHMLLGWEKNVGLHELRAEHMRILRMEDADSFPEFVVANLYDDPTVYIGEHADSDPLFAGALAPSGALLRRCKR